MSNFSVIKRSKAPLGWWVGDWERVEKWRWWGCWESHRCGKAKRIRREGIDQTADTKFGKRKKLIKYKFKYKG